MATLDGPSLVAAAARRTDEIVGALQAIGEDGLAAPSALPGWSRLTISCHLRYGAEALTRMTAATLAGEPVSYYPGGRVAARPATLAPLPGETPPDVVVSLADHSAELDRRWSKVDDPDWTREVVEPEGQADLGPIELVRLPLLRLTEVEVHGSDLALGLDDWSETFVEAALPFRLEWLNTRRSNHRAFADTLEGSWLLVATDGPTWLVTVNGPRVTSVPAEPTARATAVIEASSRDLLALLLGRALLQPPQHGGDEDFAQAFPEAFPGP